MSILNGRVMIGYDLPTGVGPGEGTGATMSDDDDDQTESETNTNCYNGVLDVSDSTGFGPLVPTESERFLMERVRQELKQEFKQVKNHKLALYNDLLV